MLNPAKECDLGVVVHGQGSTRTEDCYDVPFCGNGVIEPTETCEDGNAVSGDGCSAICLNETL